MCYKFYRMIIQLQIIKNIFYINIKYFRKIGQYNKMSHKGYTLPGYNYLGPGNDIYSEEEVVNSSDFVAYIHDLEYTLANNPEDIREADRTAIVSFIKDFKETGRVADIIGFLGLGAKYGVESVFGVQYPNMSKKESRTFSQFLFGQREKHIAEVYKSQYKSQFVNINEFKKSSYGRQLYDAYSKGGQYYKHYQAEWESRNQIKKLTDVPEEIQPGPSKRPADTGSNSDNNPPKQARPANLDPSADTGEVSPPLSPESARVLEKLLGGTDTGELSETANRASTDTQAVVPMDTSEISASGSGRGPNTGARSSPSGLSTSGRTNSAVPNLTWIRPSEPANDTHISFTKTRILISYGYSTENIQLGDPDYIECVTTPLALIPVDFLPFYLSHAEFAALPFGAKITEVNCKVTPLGTRTAFDTGTTLSGTATSEYVPIGLICEGMNKQFYGRNRQYKVSATDPMKPTSIATIKPEEIAAKYYVHIGSNALCVPQPIEQYYVHEWNRSSNPDAHQLPEYMIHNCGVARMDEKVHQFLLNPAVGEEIVHYSYKPKNGLIKQAKDHFVPWNRRSDAVETTYTRPRSMLLQFFQDSQKKPLYGDVGLGADKDKYTLINQVEEQYLRKIENYGAFHPARGATSFEAQPQLHVGLIATPQLNPGTAAISYLNSACYWKIECSCIITFNVNSAFSKNNAISWPLEVTFVQNATQKYTDGQCLFGNTDTRSGNVQRRKEKQVSNDYESDSDEMTFEIIDKKTGMLKL